MTTRYPNNIDAYNNIRVVRDRLDQLVAADHNDLRSATIAIEQTLGVNPQSVYGTVGDRMAYVEAYGRNPTGIAGGDLSGIYPGPTVVKIQNRAISSSAPTDGYALTWNNSLTQWEGQDSRQIYLNEFASLSSAVTAIGSKKVELVITKNTTVSTSLTIPTNITLVIKPNGLITVNSGQTLIINSSFTSDLYQVFTGDGNVEFTNQPEIWAEWWGFSTTETAANNTTYFEAAMVAAQGRSVLRIGIGQFPINSISYLVTSRTTGLKIKGSYRGGNITAGAYHIEYGTVFDYSANTTGTALTIGSNFPDSYGLMDVLLEEFYIIGGEGAGYTPDHNLPNTAVVTNGIGIKLTGTTYVTVRNVGVRNFETGWSLTYVWPGLFENVIAYHCTFRGIHIKEYVSACQFNTYNGTGNNCCVHLNGESNHANTFINPLVQGSLFPFVFEQTDDCDGFTVINPYFEDAIDYVSLGKGVGCVGSVSGNLYGVLFQGGIWGGSKYGKYVNCGSSAVLATFLNTPFDPNDTDNVNNTEALTFLANTYYDGGTLNTNNFYGTSAKAASLRLYSAPGTLEEPYVLFKTSKNNEVKCGATTRFSQNYATVDSYYMQPWEIKTGFLGSSGTAWTLNLADNYGYYIENIVMFTRASSEDTNMYKLITSARRTTGNATIIGTTEVHNAEDRGDGYAMVIASGTNINLHLHLDIGSYYEIWSSVIKKRINHS